MEDERRRSARFVFKRNEIQILSDDPIFFGKLRNLSKGGLSFLYTPIPGKLMATKSINILPKGKDKFNLYHLGCRTIYDILFPEEHQSLKGYKRRQCGIEFFWLKEEQNFKLRLLLEHYNGN
jgi:hypothetical protein